MISNLGSALTMTNKNFRHCCRKPVVLVPLCLITALGLVFNSKMLSLVSAPSLRDLDYEVNGMNCKPKINAVFIKTHKCASSTIQNIFMRYGDIRNLTFVLPAKGNYLGHPTPFKRNMVPDPNNYHVSYNILTHHSRLNFEEMKALMPNDTVFVTIVRDPVDLYESLYSYYSLRNVYKKSLEEAVTTLKPKLFDKRVYGRVGTNQMLFDLGYEVRRPTNYTQVLSYIESLDDWFDLVMVAERMEESLILLRHLMCWQLDDVVVFKLNARSKKLRSNLTEEMREKVRVLNSKDQLLYDYFVRRFDERIKEFGASAIEEEVLQLKNKTMVWYDYCVKSEKSVTATKLSQIIAYEQKHGANGSCRGLTRFELSYTDYLRKKQQYMFPTPKPQLHSSKRMRIKNQKRIHLGTRATRKGR